VLKLQHIGAGKVGTARPTNVTKNAQWIEEAIDRPLLAKVQEKLRPIQDETWIVGKPENN